MEAFPKKKTMDFPMDPIKSSGISRLVMSDGSPATKMVLSSLPRPSGMACAWMMDLVASRHRSPSDLIFCFNNDMLTEETSKNQE